MNLLPIWVMPKGALQRFDGTCRLPLPELVLREPAPGGDHYPSQAFTLYFGDLVVELVPQVTAIQVERRREITGIDAPSEVLEQAHVDRRVVAEQQAVVDGLHEVRGWAELSAEAPERMSQAIASVRLVALRPEPY